LSDKNFLFGSNDYSHMVNLSMRLIDVRW
jgi:hypothetical protein